MIAPRFRSASLASLFLAISTLVGCGSHPKYSATTLPVDSLQPITDPSFDPNVAATVTPPLGWHTDPLKKDPRHQHQVWLSPTDDTAYGVIHFSLPLPVGHELVLWAFLDSMKKSEGEAKLLSKKWDETLNATRFEAEGGEYKIRATLFVDGFEGWAIYAGTLRAKPVNDDELGEAILAREATRVGKPSH